MKNRANWPNWLIVAAVLTGVAGAAYGQTTTTSTPSTPAATTSTTGGKHWHHHRGGMMGGFMMHALHQLNLSDDQKQSVHTIMANARAQAKARHQNGTAPNFAALANPGDPNHAAALQAMQTNMAARIQARDAVQQQIYGLLTADQKTQLASILAAKQAK